MWILPLLTVLLAFNGGFAQIGDLMRNPLMMRALMSSGSGSGASDPMTTMMLMNPNMMEGGAANLMMMNALRGSGRGGNNPMLNMALMNPEMLSGIMPAGMAGNPAMMYYLLSQNNNNEQQSTTPTPQPTTMPGKAGNKNNTANKSSGPDFSQLLQFMALTGNAGSSDMANLGAMAAMMGGAGGSGPMSPMSVLRPEQYSTLLREGAAAHPQYAQRLCRPPTNCKIPLCTDPIKTFSAKTYFVCPECPKCPHDLMMEMFKPQPPSKATRIVPPVGKPPGGAAGRLGQGHRWLVLFEDFEDNGEFRSNVSAEACKMVTRSRASNE
ncbi:hypothetical protein KUTeg_008333 [Tegillarca granosa]|uniref:Uncharacterized protein n=1 Tax=Tegillarca granosa TaxID=220873 RepID=A0ABQ9FBK9_TEGGR|nr:hypothetical protein KUTeg_008333 [Tegillarca granosa]